MRILKKSPIFLLLSIFSCNKGVENKRSDNPNVTIIREFIGNQAPTPPPEISNHITDNQSKENNYQQLKNDDHEQNNDLKPFSYVNLSEMETTNKENPKRSKRSLNEEIPIDYSNICHFKNISDLNPKLSDYIEFPHDNDYLKNQKILNNIHNNIKRFLVKFDKCLNFSINNDRLDNEEVGFFEFFKSIDNNKNNINPNLKSFILNASTHNNQMYRFNYDPNLKIFNYHNNIVSLINTPSYFDQTRILLYNNETPNYFRFGHDNESSINFRKTPFEENNFEFYISKSNINFIKSTIIRNKDGVINICLSTINENNNEIKRCIKGF